LDGHQYSGDISAGRAVDKIIARYPVPGIESPQGIALDVSARLAFAAGEENNKVAVGDLTNMQVLATYPVGNDPDVPAFDTGLKWLYVSAESGIVTVFRENGKALVTAAFFLCLTRTRFLPTRTPILSISPCRVSTGIHFCRSWSRPEPSEPLRCFLMARPSPAPCRSILLRHGRREREPPGTNGRNLSFPFRNTRRCAPLWRSELWREACSDRHLLAGIR
jgi:hypothetical protein